IKSISIQLAEEQRPVHVVHGDRLGACEIHCGTSDAEDPAVGPRGKIEAPARELQHVAGCRGAVTLGDCGYVCGYKRGKRISNAFSGNRSDTGPFGVAVPGPPGDRVVEDAAGGSLWQAP